MDTKGVPLDIIIQILDDRGYIVDWIDFYESSIKGGWTVVTSLNKIEYSLCNVKGKEHSDEVIKRLKYYIMEQQ